MKLKIDVLLNVDGLFEMGVKVEKSKLIWFWAKGFPAGKRFEQRCKKLIPLSFMHVDKKSV